MSDYDLLQKFDPITTHQRTLSNMVANYYLIHWILIKKLFENIFLTLQSIYESLPEKKELY